MQLVGVQLDIVWENREANHAKVRSLLRASSPARGALVVLPEMFASGFSMNVAAIADERQATHEFVTELAKEFGVFVIAGVVMKCDERRGENQAIVVGPDGLLVARYSKLHPYAPSGEADHYRAGDEIVTFAWHDFTVAPFICYDLRFPEIFRRATRHGANVMAVIASWPEARVAHWVTLLTARAIENQSYVIGVNRVGSDPKLRYPGHSLIIDPSGKVIADAGNSERVLAADVELRSVLDYRASLPFLRDMREDFCPD